MYSHSAFVTDPAGKFNVDPCGSKSGAVPLETAQYLIENIKNQCNSTVPTSTYLGPVRMKYRMNLKQDLPALRYDLRILRSLAGDIANPPLLQTIQIRVKTTYAVPVHTVLFLQYIQY